MRKVAKKPHKRRAVRLGMPEIATCYETNGGKIIFPYAEAYYAKEHNASLIRIVTNGVGDVQIQDKTTGLWLTPAQAKAPRGELRSIKTEK
jgi:hypothetical protein